MPLNLPCTSCQIKNIFNQVKLHLSNYPAPLAKLALQPTLHRPPLEAFKIKGCRWVLNGSVNGADGSGRTLCLVVSFNCSRHWLVILIFSFEGVWR